ncbi:secreted protein [Melampsora americana]|nr:secreted protein [Melampsora americana]
MMNCANFLLTILISLQTIMAVPTTLIARVDQQHGTDTIQERCYGSFGGNWSPGFGLTSTGLYIFLNLWQAPSLRLLANEDLKHDKEQS